MGMEGNVLANVIWDKHASPTNYVSRTLGIEHWKLRAAIHKIKAKANLGPVDDVIIYVDDVRASCRNPETPDFLPAHRDIRRGGCKIGC
jgi:hypothetical protein